MTSPQSIARSRGVLPKGAETYSSAMAEAKNYIAWILDIFAPPPEAPVLEVGIGHGGYTEILREYGEYMGIDIDANAVEEAKGRFPEQRFGVADIAGNDFPSSVGQAAFRSIVCLNVLEHIPDHDKAVANLAKILAPGGRLFVVVPALEILTNDMDRLAGHLRRYRAGEMAGLMEAAGLHVVHARYFNPVGGLGWLANRLVRHDSLNERSVNSQIRFFDRWMVPVSRGLDPLTRRFFGQSVVAVGLKP